MFSRCVHRRCPLCDCAVVEVLHTQKFSAPRELHVPQSYAVVSCSACGFVFADHATSQMEMDADYEAHSKYAAQVSTGRAPSPGPAAVKTDPPWDVDRLRAVASYLESHVAKSSRILDAGCSSGTLLGFLRDAGYEAVVGLDPSVEAVAVARATHGVEAHAGSFTNAPPGLGTFQAITLSHTLEHITDVRAAIAALRSLLVADGLAYIEVPDAGRYDRYLVAPFHDYNTEHINHFSLETLKFLMARSGFEMIDSGRRLVYCSARDEYPVIYGLWCKTDRVWDVTPERDLEPVEAAKRYVRASARRLEAIDRWLQRELEGHPDVILWGAGQLSMKLMADTVLNGKHLAAIVDSSPSRQGMHVRDIEIVKPARVRDMPALPIVIGSIHSDIEIERYVRVDLELPNPVVMLPRTSA